MSLLRRIERYLRASNTPPARFGREVVRDPRFVFDLRSGREPRAETERRVNAWLDSRDAAGNGR
jgi:hypothetical protein